MQIRKRSIFSVFFFFYGLLQLQAKDIDKKELFVSPYLTWKEDPTTTMVIFWITDDSNDQGVPGLSYTLKDNKDNRQSWMSSNVASTPIYRKTLVLHQVHLTGLQEDSLYIFKIQGFQEEYAFKTLPKGLKTRSVRFAVGGDVYQRRFDKDFEMMNTVLNNQNIDFIVLGGDIAYTVMGGWWDQIFRTRLWEIHRWRSFLRGMSRIRGADNQLLPLLMVVGNHDIHSFGKDQLNEEIFYKLFGFLSVGTSYRCLDFGDYLSLFLLDSNHTCPIGGEQTQWLGNMLAKKEANVLKIAAYHEAGYPSYYLYQAAIPVQIRQYWVPLFEKYQVGLAFEHHNHCFKKTHPIKDGKINPQGVIYLGDGSWGAEPRVPKQNLWYLEKAGQVRACYIVSLLFDEQKTCQVEAVTQLGEIIDQFSLTYDRFLPSNLQSEEVGTETDKSCSMTSVER